MSLSYDERTSDYLEVTFRESCRGEQEWALSGQWYTSHGMQEEEE